MQVPDQKLHDALIRYQLDLRRFEAGERVKVLAILEELQKDVTARLLSDRPLTSYGRARQNELLRQAKALVSDYYSKAQRSLDLGIEDLAEAQIRHTTKMLADAVTIGTTIALPTKAVVARLTSDILIEGGPMKDWWSRLAEDTSFKLISAIRQGLVQGETNGQIAQRITGRAGQIGVLDTARRNVAAIVQTSVQTISNDAHLATYRANSDLIKYVQWFSAMDGHVCPRCIAMSGKKWRNDAEGLYSAVGHRVSFQNPPIHWNDRCVLLPITKSFRELGIDAKEVPPGERASSYGPVSSKTTFDDFLKRQTTEQQDEQLGRGRAGLWREGKITLAQLIDGRGRELTLAQLRAKYD